MAAMYWILMDREVEGGDLRKEPARWRSLL